MACTTKTSNIILEGMNVSFGKRDTNCVTPIFAVPVASSFNISTTTVKNYVWFDTTGSDTDPAIASRVGIEVDVSAAADVNDILVAMKTAMELAGYFFTISLDGLSGKIEVKEIGKPLDVLTDTDTTFTFENDVLGIGGDLGKTEAIEMSMEIASFDVTANQTGETVLDKFVTGMSAAITTNLIEMTAENWELLVGDGLGGNFTPSAGTVMTGYGDASINRSFFDIAGELVLHPVRLPVGDRSRDVTIFKCVVQPESINFDSTEKQGMAVSFTALLDETKDSNINLFAFGDSSQDLRI